MKTPQAEQNSDKHFIHSSSYAEAAIYVISFTNNSNDPPDAKLKVNKTGYILHCLPRYEHSIAFNLAS